MNSRKQEARQLLDRATALSRSGDMISAIDLLEQASRLDADDKDVFETLAALYMLTSAPPQNRLHVYERLTIIEPEVCHHWYNLGNVQRVLNKLQDATAAYMQGARHCRNAHDVLALDCGLASIAVAAEDRRSAEVHLIRAMEMIPEHELLAYRRAEFSKAFGREPRSLDDIENLSLECFAEIGREEEAVGLLELVWEAFTPMPAFLREGAVGSLQYVDVRAKLSDMFFTVAQWHERWGKAGSAIEKYRCACEVHEATFQHRARWRVEIALQIGEGESRRCIALSLALNAIGVMIMEAGLGSYARWYLELAVKADGENAEARLNLDLCQSAEDW